MKSQWFGDRMRYDFARCLAEADYSRQPWDLWKSWLQMCSDTFRQAVHVLQTGAKCPDIEARVLKEQERVPKWAKFCEATSILVSALELRAYDFLGTTLSELEMNDVSWKGQCFTPDSVCQLMARMGTEHLEPEDGRTIWLSEPACGGGAMLIATTEVLKERGFYPWHYCWQATDVDWRCFAMTYIQATLLGIPAAVIHGNTLSLQQWDSAWTFAAVVHPPRKPRAAPDDAAPDVEPLERPVTHGVVTTPRPELQRTLF